MIRLELSNVSELRDFHCDDCGKDFSENKSLQRHIRSLHPSRNRPEKPVNPVNSMSEEPSNITMKGLEESPEKIQVPNTLLDENRDPVSELTTHPAITGL